MADWARELKQEREYESDETISHLISLRHIDDDIQSNLFATHTMHLPLTDKLTLMHVRYMQTQLDAWKRESSEAGSQRCRYYWFLFLVMTGVS
jgi:hypothetical protein